MALGISDSESARRENVPERTMRNWKAEGLDVVADELAQRGWERLDPLLWRNVEVALEINHQVMTRQLARDCDEAKEARWILERALGRQGGTGGSGARLPSQGSERYIDIEAS